MVEMAREASSCIRILAVAVVISAFALPIAAQVAESTPPSLPPLTVEIYADGDSTNWIVYIVAVYRTAASTPNYGQLADSEQVYVAAWTAGGTLLLSPKILNSFNQSEYYDHVSYAPVSSMLSVGDRFIFDRSVYANGSRAALLTIQDSQWQYLAHTTFGVGDYMIPTYDPLPDPPLLPGPTVSDSLVVLIAATIVVIASAMILILRVKRNQGRLERRKP